MAAETGIPSVYLEHQLLHGRAAKKTQGLVIAKLRHKVSQPRSWTDSIKSVRDFVAERKTQTETTEFSGVQQCLDTLQQAMKVTSQQTLKERLDLIGRQLGLNTQVQDKKVSLIADAFQVEVLLGDEGNIANVMLANQGDVVDCPDLRDILMKGDFTEFTEHLQGLQSIYQVTNDEKLKSKAFLALQALEKDLNQLAQFQSSISGVANYLHKCPLGIMLPRLAGKPMKLIYFVSPYDLLDKKSLTAHPLTVEGKAITENFLGQSVTVCIESVPEQAPANKLQTMPLMNVSKTQDGKRPVYVNSLPSFSAVSKINSMMLPASFVLVLPQGMPMSVQIMQKITSQTGLEIHKEADPECLCSLVLKSFSGGKITDCRKVYVSLPDQQHIYFLDSLMGKSQDQLGVVVSRIPFTHPTHVPHILNLMRQQLLFNIVIASCIRPGAKKDTVNSIVFEVTAVSLQQLTVVFEHPAYDSMITVDIDLSDITNLKCRVSCTNSDQELCSDEAISRVFQRCMSIPIMLRWLIGKGRGHLDKLKEAAIAAEKDRLEKALFLREMQHRQAKLQPTTLPANRPPPQPPHPPPLPPPPSYSQYHHSSMHFPQGQLSGQNQAMHPMLVEARGAIPVLDEFRLMTDSNSKNPNERLLMSVDGEQVHNPLLSTLLDEEKLHRTGSQTEMHDSPMLSRLLDDNTSVATTVIPMNCKIAPSVSVKRQRKRRLPSDLSGPSPKHRVSDIDSTDRLSFLGSSIDMGMGPAMMDQSLPNTPNMISSTTSSHGSPSYHHHHPMLNHVAKAARPQSNVIDLTEVGLVGESSLKKLADSVDKHFIHKDVKNEPDLSMLLNEAETLNRIPNILQNSPSGSKNENASTSLEGFLKGSGEVGRAKDFDPSDASSVHCSTTSSKLSSLLLASTDSPTSNLSMLSHKSNSTFFSDKIGVEETVADSVGQTASDGVFLQDVKPSPASLRKGTLRQSSSVDIPNDKQITSGLFEKFDIPRQHKHIKTEAATNDIKPQLVEGKVSIKLRVCPFKQQNSTKPSMKSFNSVDETDLDYGRSNSIGTFDFKSDEDDDDLLMQFPSDRYVYSSSPTRLQISSSKQKRLNDYVSIPQKSDKTKKKDRSSGNLTKRKREKEESKREKKRKKSEHFIEESVYRTVENDTKADFKLKIRVAKKPMTDKSDIVSDSKTHSYEIKKRSLSSSHDKSLSITQEDKHLESVFSENIKEKDSVIEGNSTSKTAYNKLNISAHKSSPKSGSSKTGHSGGTTNKTDPKLVTKATIRLKPLTMPNSGSTVNISQSGPKVSNAVSNISKTDRRTSNAAVISEKRFSAHNSLLERRSSLSNLSERRSLSQSSSQLLTSPTSSSVAITTPVTPTTAAPVNLSLSSILPNAPTVSKLASLPRIPKLSSSSSNTSINRTSSLDPVSGSTPTTAGTKSNNSYTVGPAGRPNSGAISGPGGSRSSSTSGNFNYNSRPSTPAVSNNRPNFNVNRPSGPSQTSPVVNSSPGVSQKPAGPRAHNPSVSGNSHKAGINLTNSHKLSGNFTTNPVKGSTGSSSNSLNVTQKSFASGAKINNSISSKMGNNFMGQKSASSSNVMSGQRHITQSASTGNSMRSSSSSSNMCRSPNTSGLSKSPNSGKSPNITNSGKSPNITNSGKSPNITNSGKSPNITNSGKSPNITNSGRSPSLNSVNKSPNISAANKSPNISSSMSGRSPSINSNRSPNITNNTAKSASSSSLSSKYPISGSHRPSSNLAKSSVGNKSSNVIGTIKSYSSSPSQKSFNNISGSNKSLSTKTETKNTLTSTSTSASSNNQLLGNGKPGTVTTAHVSTTVNNRISSHTNPVGSSSNVESLSQKSDELQFTTSPSSMTVSVTKSSSPMLPPSPVKSNSCDRIELNQDKIGSKSHSSVIESSKSVLPEKLPASTSSTPSGTQSVDFSKTTFNFPSCRGRKNSLSAIVDKLKHNAVESVLDSPATVSSFSDGSVSATNKSSLNSELTSDINSANVCVDSVNHEKIGVSSPLSAVTAKPITSNVDIDKKHNHLLDDNPVKAVCENVGDGNTTNSGSLSSAKSLQSEVSDILCSSVSCDQSRNVTDVSQDVSHLTNSDYGHDLAQLQDSSALNQVNSLSETPESNKVIEKPSVKISMPQQSFTSSPITSPAMISSTTSASPQASSFQSLQSPGLTKNTSPLIGASISKVVKVSTEQVFKMPSSADNSDSESKPSEMFEVNSESQTDRSDNVTQENSCYNKGKVSSFKEISSAKPLSSPLSDISSPENGLIIDDESLKLTSKSSADRIFSSVVKPQSTKSPTDNTNSSIYQISKDLSATSPNILECASIANSPKTIWPPFAESPTLSKSSSGASVPKEADSPCPIDDDLMDVALGFGS